MMGRCGRTESEELQSGRATRPRGTFTTATARTTPIEYTRAERFWYRLETPIPLPSLPRPSFRKILAAIPRLIPDRVKSARASRLASAHPGIAAWLVILAGLIPVIAGHEPAMPHPKAHQARYQKWLARKGKATINASLVEIGPSVKIPEVLAVPAPESLLGFYMSKTGQIGFNSSLEYHPVELLDTAAHECVHGIFLQNKLTPDGSHADDYLTLVNEVAAYVLGAHVTGAVITREGRDGSLATEHLFQRYRGACDPDNPSSMYRHYLTSHRIASGELDWAEWRSALVHFGAPLELVDDVYEICYLNSNPVEAARKISRRFMTRDLAPRDRPILEEFERTRARWPGN